MHNNYLLLEGAGESTLARETAFHAAGHGLGEHLFRGSSPGDFWRHARLRASEAGAIEAISEVVTSLSFDVDIAVAQGENTLGVHPHDEHLVHLTGRDVCPTPEDRGIAGSSSRMSAGSRRPHSSCCSVTGGRSPTSPSVGTWARHPTHPPSLASCVMSAAVPTPGSAPRSRTRPHAIANTT